MRLWLVMLLGTVFGCSAGVAMTWYELGDEIVRFEPVSPTVGTDKNATNEIKGPRVVVEGGTKFDFGTMTFDSSAERTFVIRNRGDQPLELHFTVPSCGKCIQVDFPDTVLAPGESCDVVVGYAAKKDGANFSESASFTSNDPQATSFQLEITGIVTKPVRLVPAELAFGTVSASEGASAKIALLGYHSPKIELVDTKFSNVSMEDYFEITTTPMSKEQVAEKDEHASCGLEVQITAKPGLPLGRINQLITLRSKTDSENSADLNVTGEVVGDISIIGKGFVSDLNAISLGIVKRGQRATATLFLLAKGPHRDQVKMSVGQIDPADTLKATIGEGTPIADGKAIKFPLTIELLKTAPPQTHLGDARGKMGKIVIETTHPTAKQIPVFVRFVVE